jgi:nitroreductase
MGKATLEDLKKRRSIRSFKPGQIKDEELDAILEAGTWAPSGGGGQSAVMVAIQDKAIIDKLEKLNAQVLGDASKKPFYGAPTVIAVLADKTVKPTFVEDGSLVLGNLQIAAYAVGVGSCWIHRAKEVFAGDEGRAFLKEWGLSDNFVGVGFCILGYAEGDVPAPKPRKANYIIKAK